LKETNILRKDDAIYIGNVSKISLLQSKITKYSLIDRHNIKQR